MDAQISEKLNVFSNMRLLKMNDIENWIKLRNQSVQSLKTTQKESDIASEIFTLWDVHFRHYLKFD